MTWLHRTTTRGTIQFTNVVNDLYSHNQLHGLVNPVKHAQSSFPLFLVQPASSMSYFNIVQIAAHKLFQMMLQDFTLSLYASSKSARHDPSGLVEDETRASPSFSLQIGIPSTDPRVWPATIRQSGSQVHTSPQKTNTKESFCISTMERT